MKKLAFGVFFTFLQASVFGLAHHSKLNGIYDTINGGLIELGGLKNLVTSSNSQDEAGVCYGNLGNASKHPETDFPPYPRCHSEFYLLKRIKESIPNLSNFKISIVNEKFPPCKLRRGQPKFSGQELNPGTPCDEYLNTFARDNHCSISVKVFGNTRGVEYPK